jgi:hypothetical protein
MSAMQLAVNDLEWPPVRAVAAQNVLEIVAVDDARADRAAGDWYLYRLMEVLYLGGHLKDEAWQGYCRVYRRART